MNKTKIDWADYTWNPITGCLHGCPYCYAHRIAERFKCGKAFPNGFDPTWHPERLTEPLHVHDASRIFVCSMADPFGGWVNPDWLQKIWTVMRVPSAHRFLFLTKRPKNIAQKLGYLRYERLSNVWLGCTLTGAEGEQDPSPSMCELQDIGWHCFVSIEPLLGAGNPDWYSWAEWAILGAMTGPGKVAPQPEWIISWLDAANKTGIPVWMKGSMHPFIPGTHELPWRQERPPELEGGGSHGQA